MADLIGQRLGQYEIVAPLGRGGMATVYRARQLTIDRDVAIKVIDPDLSDREDFMKRFRREAQTIAMLSHPHILKMFDYGQVDNLIYLVMELLPGGSLSDLVKKGALSVETSARMLEQIGTALDYAHQRGIIHRDLKPQNVLLDENNNVFLSDFGIAKIVRDVSTLTADGSVLGTPSYMSPEQWRGEPVDSRSDIYSLGVILFQMLTGQLPFVSNTPFTLMHMHIYDQPPSLSAVLPTLSATFDAVLAKALAKDREERFISAQQMAAAFKSALSGNAPDLGPQPVKPPAGQAPAARPTGPLQRTVTSGKVASDPTEVMQPAKPPAAPPAVPIPVRVPSGPPPTLYTVLAYLGGLVAEREADEPFMLSQLQPALLYKFPNFKMADYNLAGVKDFIVTGEKAGYFKLVNTGSAQTSYLAPGPKAQSAPAPADPAAEVIDPSDPRRLRWMTTAMEALLAAERGDQLLDAIRGVNALAPEFDAFLAAEGKSTAQYQVRGKIQRLRDFLKTYRDKGEALALANWQTNRMLLRMPTIPEVRNAAAAQSLIWSILQGNNKLASVPLDLLDNVFFAVLIFSRDQMARNKSWDWVAGLNILEAEARAVPRPVPPPAKRGLFGSKQPEAPRNQLDDNEIRSLVEVLRSTAGLDAASADPTPTWQAYVDTPNLDAGLRYLLERPKLVEDEHLLNWLDDQISHHVAEGKLDAIKNLAEKCAIVITARQFGLREVPKHSNEFRQNTQAVMDSVQLLRVLFGFVDAPLVDEAITYYQQHSELGDVETTHFLFDDQTMKATRHGDVARYRQLTDRADLWRQLAEFGPEEGLRQHQRYLAAERSDRIVMAEMGVMLLAEAKEADVRQEIISQYPSVVSQEALDIVAHMLDHLSFHNASTEDYNHYFEVKRIIEKCLQLGVDRALAELK